MRVPRQLLAATAVTCCALGAACDGGDTSGGRARAAASPAPGRPADVAASIAPGTDGPGPDTLFPGRLPPLGSAEQEEIRRRDPAADGWPSEALQERAAWVLRAFLERVLNPVADDGGDLDALLAPDFAGLSDLRPPLEVVHEGASVTVWRPAGEPTWHGAERTADEPPAATARTIAGALRDAALGAERVRVELELVRFDLDATEAEGEAWVELSALDEGAPVQQSLRLAAAFAAGDGPDGAPRLRELRLLDYEEVRWAERPFVELTGRVFDHPDFFPDEFQRGVEAYHLRMDRLAAGASQGMQGLAVADVDGDGLEDVYVCQQGGLPNRLFRHLPDGSAEDVGHAAGLDFLDVSRSALIVDLNGDGRRDLAVAVRNNVVVAYSDGSARFNRQLVLPGPTSEDIYSLSTADADGDGDLDLFCARYGTGGVMRVVPTPYHDAQNGAPNLFWRNDGEGSWVLATEEFGFDAGNSRFSLCSIWEDLDGDGDLDLYVVNDFGRNNLYRNEGGGRFVDVADQVGAADMAAGMGASCADHDLDGDPDLYVTNMFSAHGLRVTSQGERFMGDEREALRPHYVRHARGNTLLANRGDGTFEDATDLGGVALGRWGWGGRFVDFQNDGYEDLCVPNGFITNDDPGELNGYFWRRVTSQSPAGGEPTQAYRDAWSAITYMTLYQDASWSARERNTAFLNLGGGRYANVSSASGLDFADDARAVAALDWDDDGRLDLLLKNRTAPRLRFLHNRDGSGARWISFELVGAPPNTDAVGALVTLAAGERSLRRRLYAGDGYLSQTSPRLHFGLGDAERAGRVAVTWPDGTRQELGDLEPGRRYRVVQGGEGAQALERRPVDLASAPESPLEPIAGDVQRVVLATKLPAAALPLPSFASPGRRLADFAGRPVLLALWSSYRADPLMDLGAFLEHGGELARRDLAVVPMTVDEGRDLARARRITEQYEVTAHAGYADRDFLQILEILLIEVLGPFEDVPLPSSYLFDAQGQLVAFYLGPIDVEQLIVDAERLRAANPAQSSGVALSGGRWSRRGPRDLRNLSTIFTQLGRADLASFYGQIAQR